MQYIVLLFIVLISLCEKSAINYNLFKIGILINV